MERRKVNAAGLRQPRVRARRVCALLLLAAFCCSLTAEAQTTEFVELASPNASGTSGGNARSSLPRASDDGRLVVFSSDASDLVAGDSNGTTDVFVRDLQLDTTRLVSVNASGTGSGNGISLAASITPDGRFVIFNSGASDLVANDSNGARDVFVRDLQQNTTTLVSVNSAGGASADGDSFPGFLTPDGRFAVFNSAASDLVAGVGVVSQKDNVFRRDLQTGATVMVSVNAAGTSGGNGHSAAQAITPDGRFVLFHSSAADITADDTNGFTSDIFRRDMQAGTTALVSVNRAGTGAGNDGAGDGVMSDDGRVVAFSSSSTDLVAHPGPGRGFTSTSIYVRDFAAGTTSLVSEPQVFQGTVMTVPPARLPRISPDGRYVFYLRFENFITGLNRVGFRDRVFRRDRQTGDLFELPFVSNGLCDQGFNCRSIVDDYVTSADGRYVAYRQFERSRVNPEPYSTSIVVRDMVGGGFEIVNGLPGLPFNMPGDIPRALRPGNVVSGGRLAFHSGVAHAPGDTNALEDVYLYAPPSQTRLAFDKTDYFITEGGAFAPVTQLIRVRRAGYLMDSASAVRFATSGGTAAAGSDYAARSETLTFEPGEAEKLLALQVFNDEEVEPSETVALTLGEPTGNSVLGARSGATLNIADDDPHFFQFDSASYEVSEAGFSAVVTVTVTGTPTVPVSVAYSTSDGTASERSDYVTARGRLTFAPGETSKSFRLLVVNDAFVEGDETVNLALSDPRGGSAAIGATRGTAVLRIASDDAGQPASNPVDTSDFFVRQHYYDFLNRLPDADGSQFWTNEIESCGADAQCREVKRINVSAAFFLSIEFQTTGFLAYLTNRAAFGTRPPYAQFMHDVQNLQRDFVFGHAGAAAQLEANRRAFFDEFVTRPAFVSKFGGMSGADYVGTLLAENGLAPTVGNLFVSRLDGAQVVPPAATGATGVVVLRRLGQAGTGNVANVSLSLRNLTGPPALVHIHGPAALGANAPVLRALPAGEFADFQVTLTDEEVSRLNAGQLYIDVHTQNFPDGEIRARLGPARFRGDVLTNALNDQTLTRAQVLRIVAESEELRVAEFNRAFVLMEYFGYLRRDPDEDGYNFWLNKLNQFNGDYIRAEMVKAFISSDEYRRRFGP